MAFGSFSYLFLALQLRASDVNDVAVYLTFQLVRFASCSHQVVFIKRNTNIPGCIRNFPAKTCAPWCVNLHIVCFFTLQYLECALKKEQCPPTVPEGGITAFRGPFSNQSACAILRTYLIIDSFFNSYRNNVQIVHCYNKPTCAMNIVYNYILTKFQKIIACGNVAIYTHFLFHTCIPPNLFGTYRQNCS